jgi:aminomethyltransferase
MNADQTELDKFSALATEVGETVKVVIRDKELNAVVVKPPFVRHGKALV